MSSAAVAVESRCPACDNKVTSQRDVKPFKQPYLCAFHRQLWDAAWASEIAKEKVRA